MADQSLQAFQLGASLYERGAARAQAMNQLRQNMAEFALREKQAELENRIRENDYSQALQEKKNQAEELEQFHQFNEQVVNVWNDPSGSLKLPPVPRFKSKLFNQEAMKAIAGLEQYSSRAKLMKEQSRLSALMDHLELKRMEDARRYNALVRNEDGTYKIDDNLLAQKLKKEEQLKTASEVASYAKLGVPAVQRMIESGQIPEEISQQALIAAQAFDKSKQGAVEKNVNLFIDSAKARAAASGIPLSDAREAELRQSFISGGGRLKPLPERMATKLEDEFAVMETIDALSDGVSDFEKRYQGKKFADFLGKIPSTEMGIKSLFAEEKDPMKKEALGLLADFMGVVNGTARTTSGLNVTTSEAKRIAQEIGGFFDKNSMIKLDRFRDRIERSARGTIGRNIDRSLPSFYERWSMTPFGTRTTAVYSVPAVPFQPPESMSLDEMQRKIQALEERQ